MNLKYIIQIESATKNCSVALSCNGKTLSLKEVAQSGYTHAENLHVFIDEIIKDNSITYDQIAAVAVSKGPGSYTGLRIGVSAAKGLCFALDIPLIALDTLEILSKRISVTEGLIIPLLDARRMEVYAAVYSPQGNILNPVESKIINADSFLEYKDTTIHLCGDGALKCKDVIQHQKVVLHQEQLYPSAGDMSKMSFDKFQNQQFENVAYFEPFYLKEFFTGN